MTPLGWLFMGTAWAAVGGLAAWCFARLLRAQRPPTKPVRKPSAS